MYRRFRRFSSDGFKEAQRYSWQYRQASMRLRCCSVIYIVYRCWGSALDDLRVLCGHLFTTGKASCRLKYLVIIMVSALKPMFVAAPSIASAYSLIHSYDYTNWYSSFTFETVGRQLFPTNAISHSTGGRSNKRLCGLYISIRCPVYGNDKHNQQSGLPRSRQQHCPPLLDQWLRRA